MERYLLHVPKGILMLTAGMDAGGCCHPSALVCQVVEETSCACPGFQIILHHFSTMHAASEAWNVECLFAEQQAIQWLSIVGRVSRAF